MVEINYNPYEGVDFDSVRQCPTDLHCHPWKVDEHSFELIDYATSEYAPTVYAEELSGYDIFGMSAFGAEERTSDLTGETYQAQLYWPWEDPSWRMVRHTATEYPEPRDPEELETIAIWTREVGAGSLDHIHQHFGINSPSEDTEVPADGWPDGDQGRQDGIDWIINDQEGAVTIAHPHSTGLSAGAMTEFSEHDPHDLLGIEIANTKGESFTLWDELNDLYLEDRGGVPVFGHAMSDRQDTMAIGDEGMRWELVFLIDEQLIDFSNQGPAREAIEYALRHGETYSIIRDSYSAETADDIPDVPVLEDVTVDADEKVISLDTLNADSIEWIQSGEVVETGDELFYDESQYSDSYVRAKLESPGGESHTQPFTFKKEFDEQYDRYGYLQTDKMEAK